ncbi:hypothetical protein QLX41_gp003 [Listeria phage LMTA-94]|uniref:Uncharacterized protein n=3 Tax=Pecentumvirus TaxID=1857844 RepID=A0A060ALE4_9CAUD|nr:hypothetical protein HH39_gp019 [Listeria phage LMSP-25]YP_009616122.1 hypothetical protein FDI77_gp019 [Listeria phage LMTA-34]YP_009793502.1 hypothetical protein QLX41_gp003 [Listeria phage LMTA-94]AIA64362.1 hypothetical protein [Listeria phage LMSP-25]AID16920.1 hypothetical protein [Listeria phage LMTA-34]AID17091.1 hypothetical protein [Listeria phage LMTA-94]
MYTTIPHYIIKKVPDKEQVNYQAIWKVLPVEAQAIFVSKKTASFYIVDRYANSRFFRNLLTMAGKANFGVSINNSSKSHLEINLTFLNTHF